MKALMLGACLAAVLGAPALAQPYDRDQGGGYQDQPDPYYDQGQPGPQPAPQPPPAGQGGYQDDRGYQPGRGYDQQDRVYEPDRGYPARPGWRPYDGAPLAARYTGRVGAAWRNGQGQSCAWRELTWQDPEGGRAYRWVPRCRY